MKQLMILRHAKSDWSDGRLRDFDRPLNSRGEEAAAFMGDFISKYKVRPEAIFSSPAKRARMTAQMVAKKSKHKMEPVFIDKFYGDDYGAMVEHIKSLPDSLDSALLIGHNPTLENLVSFLVSEGSLNIDLPTAGLVVIESEMRSWNKLHHSYNTLKLFVTPRSIQRYLA